MSVNFFQADCETITSAVKFGICDGENTYPAFLNFDALVEKWIAEVENEEEIEVIFTAIDNCIDILDENGETQSRCDAMMRYAENLIFIELKSSLMHMLSSVGDLHHLDFISTFISLKLLWFFSGVE
mgnify:CR=1 FL=1